MSTEALHGEAVSLEEIVAQDPTTAFYLPLAEKLLSRGSVGEAVRLCEERRTRPGRGVGDHIVLGRCYLADGRLPEAREEFRAALGLDRENVIALKSLAGIFSHEGRHGDAADLYRAVCRVDPGDLESQSALHQITSGDYPEVRPPEVIVGQGDLTWQPVRLAREENHLSELGLGLRTLESHDAGVLRPAPSATAARPSVPPAAPPASGAEEAATSQEEPLDVDDFMIGEADPPPAPWAPPTPLGHRPPTDPTEDRLGGIDVGAFQESALERLEEALRPIEARPLGEVEPTAPAATSRSAIWTEAKGAAEAPHEVAAPAVPAAPAAPERAEARPSAAPVPAAPDPESGSEPPIHPAAVVPPAPGNRAAFETWLRNLGGGGRA